MFASHNHAPCSMYGFSHVVNSLSSSLSNCDGEYLGMSPMKHELKNAL